MDEPQKLQISNLTRKTFSVDEAIRAAANECGKMDQQTFGELLFHLYAMTGRKEMPGPRVVRGWYIALRDLDEAAFMRGIDRYIREKSRDYLSPQLIIELSGVQATSEAAALEAWTLAVEAIRIVGGYARPSFSDPLVSQTIASLGGWVAFCDTEPETLRNFTRARFLKTYEALASDGRKKYPARLVSLIDASGNPSETISLGMVEGSVRRLSNSGMVKAQ